MRLRGLMVILVDGFYLFIEISNYNSVGEERSGSHLIKTLYCSI